MRRPQLIKKKIKKRCLFAVGDNDGNLAIIVVRWSLEHLWASVSSWLIRSWIRSIDLDLDLVLDGGIFL